MTTVFQPPPTWADPTIIDDRTGKIVFNPIWLKWFVDLTKNVTSSGGGSGSGAGDVVGPASTTDNRITLFNGATGKVIKELGSLGTTTTLLHGNAAGAPTFAAVANADLTNSSVTYNGKTVALGASATLGLASADFVNQGTTTTVLHGNAAGNPSFAAVNLKTDITSTVQVQDDIGRFGFPGVTGAATQDDTTLTTVTFDGTITFTLAPKTPATTWSYYRSGLKYTIIGSKTATIPAGTGTTTIYFIYIDATDGTLSVSNNSWTLNDTKVPVYTLTRNSGMTPEYVICEERHTVLIDRRTHYEHHFTEGTQMQTVGELSGYTLNSSTDAQKTFAIADSILLDEDIISNLAGLTQPDGTAADYFVTYRTASAAWAWKTSAMPFVYNPAGTNVIQYDSAGTMTDTGIGTGSNKRWANSYLCMSNIQGVARHFIIPGRSQFTSLVLARAEDPSTFTFGSNFLSAEFRIVYQMTWAVISGAGAGQCQLAATPKSVTVAAIQTSGSGVSIQHNTLAGLDGGTTGEYYHLSSAVYGVYNSGTAGNLVAFNASGIPAAVATGTAAQILTSNGAGAAPTFQDAAGGGQLLGTAVAKAIAWNAQTIAEDITIGATQNGYSAGPVSIDSGYSVTITSGGEWVII